MNKVAILGSGKVGKAVAYNLLKSDIPGLSIILYNRFYEPAYAAVKDMAPVSILTSDDDPKISATDDISDIQGADIIVVAVGKKPCEKVMSVARNEGWDREAQSCVTAPIVLDLISQASQYAPNALLAIVTNQVDTMVQLISQKTNYEEKNIFGIGGMVDTARFDYCLRQALTERNISIKGIATQIYGYHNNDMFYAQGTTLINGEPVFTSSRYTEAANIALERTRIYGQRISQLQKTHTTQNMARLSGSYILAAEVITRFCQAFLSKNSAPILSTFSIPTDKQHHDLLDIKNTSVGMPILIKHRTIERIYDVQFHECELTHLRNSVEKFNKLYDDLVERLN